MTLRVLLHVDHAHVLRVMEARLEREGFTRDTPDRRRLAKLMAGPTPHIIQNHQER